MAPDFATMLDERLAAAGLTLSEFARHAGVPQPNLTDIRKGRRPVPLKHVDSWASLLGLENDARERFLDLAALTHAPTRIRTLILAAEKRLGRTLREYTAKTD